MPFCPAKQIMSVIIPCSFCIGKCITITYQEHANRLIRRHLYICQSVYAYECENCSYHCVWGEQHLIANHEKETSHKGRLVNTRAHAEAKIQAQFNQLKRLYIEIKNGKDCSSSPKSVVVATALTTPAAIVSPYAFFNCYYPINYSGFSLPEFINNNIPCNNNNATPSISTISSNTEAHLENPVMHVNSIGPMELDIEDSFKLTQDSITPQNGFTASDAVESTNYTKSLEKSTFPAVATNEDGNNHLTPSQFSSAPAINPIIPLYIPNNTNPKQRLIDLTFQRQATQLINKQKVTPANLKRASDVVRQQHPELAKKQKISAEFLPAAKSQESIISYKLNSNKQIGHGGQAAIYSVMRYEQMQEEEDAPVKTELILKVFKFSQNCTRFSVKEYVHETIEYEAKMYSKMKDYDITRRTNQTELYIRRLWNENNQINEKELMQCLPDQSEKPKLQKLPLNYLIYTKYDATFERRYFKKNNPNAALLKQFVRCNKIEIMLQLCKALLFIHKCGILHCDIKEGNIFIDLNLSRCYIGDFGSAVDEENHQTDKTTISVKAILRQKNDDDPNIDKTNGRIPANYHYYRGGATLAYIAPELIRFKPDKLGEIKTWFTEKADIYSLAVTLCHIFHYCEDIQFPYTFAKNKEILNELDADHYYGPCRAIITPQPVTTDSEHCKEWSIRAEQLLNYIPQYKNLSTTHDIQFITIVKCLQGMLQIDPVKRFSLSQCINILKQVV